MVNRNMQHRDLDGETTLGSHDINMTAEEARNASKGRISKDLAHSAVISFGRGSTINTVSTLAREGDMRVP